MPTPPLISIAIPTYEMKGQGVFFLQRCLDSIAKQINIQPGSIEILISDQSSDDVIAKSVERLPFPFAIRYLKVRRKRGVAAHNLNTAIAQCHGDYIKILFQDDLLVEDTYLQTLTKAIALDHPDCILSGAVHTEDGLHFHNPITPSPNPYFLFGNNTVSSPSVLTLKRGYASEHPFDEHLKMLFDCDFYYRLFERGAMIVVLDEIHIANGIWHGQAQHGISAQQLTREVRYLHRKFPNAKLPKLLPAYQQLFRELHPNAPFPFDTNLEQNLWDRLFT